MYKSRDEMTRTWCLNARIIKSLGKWFSEHRVQSKWYGKKYEETVDTKVPVKTQNVDGGE